MKARILTAIDEVTRAEWNALDGTGQPFLRHEFLSALERQGCVGGNTGWTPVHITLRDEAGRLTGALPLYRKQHSWGEFVFDFAWAQAYGKHGLDYYPKLVSTIPFTPAGGPRFLTAAPDASPLSDAVGSSPQGQTGFSLRRQLLDAALEFARSEKLSSLHVLFPEQAQAEELAAHGLLLRRDCQFHWHNQGYADFEAFLGGFTADKRKKAHRERRRVREAGIEFKALGAGDIDARLWRQIYAFKADTFMRRGHLPYLSLGFFEEIARTLPDSIVVQLALHQGAPVAAAICFKSADTLYGRYWGSGADFHSLHFETCYHQGIEYCIRQGLRHFEPGTQGEHKVSRGFVPSYTWSAHWIADPRFRNAIDDYLQQESAAVQDYALEIAEHVPYKQASAEHAPLPAPFAAAEPAPAAAGVDVADPPA